MCACSLDGGRRGSHDLGMSWHRSQQEGKGSDGGVDPEG